MELSVIFVSDAVILPLSGEGGGITVKYRDACFGIVFLIKIKMENANF
jgi:hypothetical protein